MARTSVELEKRFLVPFPPLTPPRSIGGFRLVNTINQRAETFYFDTSDNKIFSRKSTLRIRIYGSEVIIDLKAGGADSDKNLETSTWITKDDLDAILADRARIQDFFKNTMLLPQDPLMLTGHLITHRIAARYRKNKEEVELALDECWDDLPIGPFFVAEIENKTAGESSFYRVVQNFQHCFPVIPTKLSKYLIVRKRQRGEPVQEIRELNEGVKETIRVIKTLLRNQKDASPIILFVTGGSASGKTELFAKKICGAIEGARILSMDDAFYGPEWMKAHGLANYDDPRAMDIALFRTWLRELLEGRPVTKKVYKFGTEPDSTESISPPRVIVAEGIHALHETLDDIPGLRIFVDTTTHCRFVRRVYRDAIGGRTGQSIAEVIRMFLETVEPSYEKWIAPTKSKAHLVVVNQYDPLREAELIEGHDIQLKIPFHVTLDPIRAKITRMRNEIHFDVYFAPPHQDIARRKEVLRVRRMGIAPDELLLTYKAVGPKGQRRFDAPMSSRMFSLFLKYWRPIAVIRKTRTAFDVGSVTVNLDATRELGNWTEFCACLREDMRELRKIMQQLGVDPKIATEETYLSMMLKQANSHK